jgi:hypothetical protein
MGFANSVRMMLAKEQSIVIPLLGFNVGLEIGQIAVVIIVLSIFYILSTFLKLKKKHWVMLVSPNFNLFYQDGFRKNTRLVLL